MSICPAKFIPREMKTTIIKVYSYKNKNIQGITSNPFFEQDMVFENMMQLITMVERISDSLVYPQKAMQLRQFSGNNQNDLKEMFTFQTSSDFSNMKPIATFELEIIFRQNASWQGSVTWLEGRKEQSFRSVLELILLMDSALSSKEPVEQAS